MTHPPPDAFQLRRHLDGLIYTFHRTMAANGQTGFKRTDGDYWILRHSKLGWVAADWRSDAVFGRPWDHQAPQSDAAPPEGIWVSRKGSKAYVYDLVYL